MLVLVLVTVAVAVVVAEAETVAVPDGSAAMPPFVLLAIHVSHQKVGQRAGARYPLHPGLSSADFRPCAAAPLGQLS